jgi:ABC-type transport system substrate-binding protein
MPRKRRSLFVLAVALAMVVTACGIPDPEGPEEEVEDTQPDPDADAEEQEVEESEAGEAGDRVLRIAVHEPPDQLDAATIYGNRSIQIAQNLYDTLVVLDDDLEIAPHIAEDWEISDDATLYTFYLRDDVTFQNGDPVTAQDFVYSINRALHPDVGNPHGFMMNMILGASEVGDGAEVAEGLRALDDHTLEIEMERPVGYFLALATTWMYSVVHEETVEANPDDWMLPPHQMATGPYQLVEQQTDEFYAFEANPDYFLGAPAIDRVEVTVVPDATTQMARYEAGDFDAIFNIAPADLLRVEADADLSEQFGQQSMMQTAWLSMLTSQPPFDDLNVRLAFSHAIDKEALIDVALEGQGSPAHTFLPPGMPSNVVETREPTEYDPDRARELLAEAGFPDGDGFPQLDIHFNATTENQAVFEVVQSQLNEVLNIGVGLESMPAQAYSALIQEPPENRPLLSRGNMGADYPDPQEFHEFLSTCWGFHNREDFCDETFDALVEEAIALPDQERRISLHREAEEHFLDQAPLVPLFYPVTTWLAKPNVEDFGFTPLYMREWYHMSVTN